MIVGELNFTRDWTNPADFPVTVNSEREARENLQRLHNETRDYLNRTLRPEVNNAANRVTQDDAVPGVHYRIGVNDGEIYYEEVQE